MFGINKFIIRRKCVDNKYYIIEYSNSFGVFFHILEYFDITTGDYTQHQFGSLSEATRFCDEYRTYKKILKYVKKEQERFINHKKGKKVNYTLKEK